MNIPQTKAGLMISLCYQSPYINLYSSFHKFRVVLPWFYT